MTGISDILGGVLSPIKDIIGEVVVDPNKRDQLNLQLAQLQEQAEARLQQLVSGQLDINKVEAASSSMFVAGWRPGAGWVAVAALAYSAVLEPLMSWVATVGFGYGGSFPILDTTITMQVLMGMLGLGVMRSYDKKQGTDTSAITKKADQADAQPAPSVAPKKKHFHIF